MHTVSSVDVYSSLSRKRRSAVAFSAMLLLSSYAAFEFGMWEALATTDADGDPVTVAYDWFVNGFSTGETGTGLDGTGEGPALVTKELALDEVGRCGPTVKDDKGLVLPPDLKNLLPHQCQYADPY